MHKPKWPIRDASRPVGSLSQEAKKDYFGEKMSIILTMYVIPKESTAWDPAVVVEQHGTYHDLDLLVPDMIRFSQRLRGENEIEADWLLGGGDSFELSCFPVSRVRDSLRHMNDFFNRHAHRFALYYRAYSEPAAYEFFFDGSDKVHRLAAGDGECYAHPEPFARGSGPVIDFREGFGPRVAKRAIHDPESQKYNPGEAVAIKIEVETLWNRAHGPQFLALVERASDDKHKIYITRG